MKLLWAVSRALAGIMMLWAVSVSAPGCAGNEPLQVVRVATRTPDGQECLSAHGFEMLARPMKESESAYELLLSPGTMLQVESRSGGGTVISPDTTQQAGVGDFCYIYRGDERQPLAFVGSEGVALLNGQPVFLDLRYNGFAQWLRAQPPGQLKTLRSLALGADRELNIRVLQRVIGCGVVLDMGSYTRVEGDKDLANAIVAARPAGLIASHSFEIWDLLPHLTDLTHLAVGGDWNPLIVRDARYLHHLRFLSVDLRGATSTTKPSSGPVSEAAAIQMAENLSSLSELVQLRSLRLKSCQDVLDYSPLGRLRDLRNLAMEECEQFSSFADLAPLIHLQSLAILETEKLQTLSGIERFGNLETLAIVTSASEPDDLTPLAKLQKLKFLMLHKDSLESRKAELDVVRKANPSLEIVGFCMGSAWIMLILPGGAIGGIAYRVLRARPRRR